MIKVDNLTKRFGRHSAVSGATFEVSKGDVVGFLGPNGAGKTTIMRLLSGYLTPDSGNIEIYGYNILSHPNESKSKIEEKLNKQTLTPKKKKDNTKNYE